MEAHFLHGSTARTYSSGAIAIALFERDDTVPAFRIILKDNASTDTLYISDDDDGDVVLARIPRV